MAAPSETSYIESFSRLRNILEESPSPSPDRDTLDPSDWPGFRAQAHRMLDDILDYTQHIRERPVWQPIPPTVRDSFRQPLPLKPANLASVHDTFMRSILPYSVGNAHPGFKGWVHGGGTPVGMLAEMLEKLGFQQLVEETLTVKRQTRSMPMYGFILGMVLEPE